MHPTWDEPMEAPYPTHDYETIGRDFAERSLTKAFDEAHSLCRWEMERLRKGDEPALAALKLAQALDYERREALRSLLAERPVPDTAVLKQKRWLCLGATAIFSAAGIALAWYSLSPLGLGWEIWPIALAFGFLGILLLSLTLDQASDPRVLKRLLVAALVGYLVVASALGVVRADLFSLNVTSMLSNPDSQSDSVFQHAAEFYRGLLPYLTVFCVLLTLVMEFAAGIALHFFWELGRSPDLADEAKAQEKVEVEAAMVARERLKVQLENRPQVAEAGFQSGFQKACVEFVNRSLVWLILGLALGYPSLRADAQVANVVIGIDFTRSVSERGYEASTNFEKNVKGARDFVTRLPPGARVTVAAISDHSFSSPLILVSGTVPIEHGPLSLLDLRDAAHHRLANEVTKQCAAHAPDFEASDILGFLALSSELLRPSSGKKILVIFSDMRQAGDGLNFNTPVRLTPDQLSQSLGRAAPTDLKGVDVYVLGADAIGKDARYWNDLKSFWERYFKTSGANLRAYSLTRDVPDFAGKAQ